ncbi:MAG: ECF-type sigma factor, partial [Acidobacteriota bacterium]
MSYDPQAGEITGLLTAWDDGDLGARNRLFHIVYPKLRHQARSMLLRYRHRASLEAGDIVSEVYLRLASRRDGRWKNSGQFLAVTRKLSHSVLIDEVRFRLRQKRGGREQPVPLADASPPATDHRADDVITRQALADLRQVDPLAARVCRLRFERGMTYEETADAVGTSRATVGRAQKFARA